MWLKQLNEYLLSDLLIDINILGRRSDKNHIITSFLSNKQQQTASHKQRTIRADVRKIFRKISTVRWEHSNAFYPVTSTLVLSSFLFKQAVVIKDL